MSILHCLKKINSKQIKDKCKTQNHQTLKKTGEKLFDLGFTIFFYMMPKVQARKAKINKGDYEKLKKAYTHKRTNKVKRQPPKQEKIPANYIF